MEIRNANISMRTKMNTLKHIYFSMLVALVFIVSAQAEKLIVLRYDNENFIQSLNGIKGEVEGEVEVIDKVWTKDLSSKDIKEWVEEYEPFCFVLMDNRSIKLYREYQLTLPDSVTPTPSICLMAVLVDQELKDLKNATGIGYEIPIITSIISLRKVLENPVDRVGVVHREIMNDLVVQNREYCQLEKIELLSRVIEPKTKNITKSLKKALDNLVKEDKIEALWVLNDNKLLTSETISKVWVPFVKKHKIPVIVGIEVLVKPSINFGTFAVLPDHTALGVQAAEMIFTILDGDQASDISFEPPFSVYKVINAKQADKYFKIKSDGLENVDKVLK